MATRLNLEEVARLSGVSRSTVSRVINDDRNVSDETREKVLAVIRQFNYQPHAAARGLAAGRTRILGLVVPMGVSAIFTDPYFGLLIQGVCAASSARDYSVMLWLADPEHERRTLRQVVHGGLLDGAIVSSMLIDDPLVQALAESQLPFVLVGRHPTDMRVSYVDVDNLNAARQAVAHLLRLGRRRVATITGLQNMIVGADRRDGYFAALRDRGLVPDPALVAEGDFTEAGGYAAARRLLAHQPDAIFCASDALAAGALRALRDAGRRVPEDVAVVGFDDMPFAAHAEPPLTTVRQPIQPLGAVAADTLVELICDPDSGPRRVILPTDLVIRASCGAAPVQEEHP